MGFSSQALGLIQTLGMVPALYGADKMLKAGSVDLVGYENIGSTLVAIIVRGDVAAVEASVAAGKEAAASVGDLRGSNVMPRAIEGVHQVVSLHATDPFDASYFSQAIGLVETFGIVDALEAADAMVKCSSVDLVGYENVASGYISILVQGDVEACNTAVRSGVSSVERIGSKAYSSVVISSPHPMLKQIVDCYSLENLLRR